MSVYPDRISLSHNGRGGTRRRQTLQPLRAASALLVTTFAIGQLTPPTCPSTNQPPTEGIHHNSTARTPAALEATLSEATNDPSILPAREPANLGVARYRIEEYASCSADQGCYWADLDAQSRRAEAELDRLLAQHHATTSHEAEHQKLAIVLDIDETALSAYCEETREDYGFIPEMFNTWVVSPAASIPIPGTLRLFRHARAAGVSVFFLTGRPHEQTDATARNLHTAGYDGWQELILRSEAQRHLATTDYKSAERARIAAHGYTLLLNVGDQWSDLLGTPRAELSVKLPNPFYYLP